MKLDVYLRMRRVWLVVYPLVAFICISVITQISVFFMLPIFFLEFPVGILKGAGFASIDKHPGQAIEYLAIGFIFVFFSFYIWFVVKIRTLSEHALRIISFGLILALIFGIRGCVDIIRHVRI